MPSYCLLRNRRLSYGLLYCLCVQKYCKDNDDDSHDRDFEKSGGTVHTWTWILSIWGTYEYSIYNNNAHRRRNNLMCNKINIEKEVQHLQQLHSVSFYDYTINTKYLSSALDGLFVSLSNFVSLCIVDIYHLRCYFLLLKGIINAEKLKIFLT